MNPAKKRLLTELVSAMVITSSLVACNSNPARKSVCSPPTGPGLERALSAARADLDAGCQHAFDAYFQQLLVIAEGDPKKDNKVSFSEFLLWANDSGLLSKRQAQEIYSRYFGIKYVSLVSDYSVCSQTCPKRSDVMRNMRAELSDKEQGLLKVSADRVNYTRASNLYQETELVLQATCEACGVTE
jgi:hypothetical protein